MADLVDRTEVMNAVCAAVADAWEKKNVSVAGAIIDAINGVPARTLGEPKPVWDGRSSTLRNEQHMGRKNRCTHCGEYRSLGPGTGSLWTCGACNGLNGGEG